MGLDAVVFRNIRNLESAYGEGLFDVDQTTGEAIPKPNITVDVPRNAYHACETRFGNAAAIGGLRKTVEKSLPPKSFIVDRILYSGSHSGDTIGVNELPQVRKEIQLLRTEKRAEVIAFLDALETLLTAANAEGNPIVFV